jgi:DNA (cytosine-5)-methyltransferase 1
MAGFDVVGFDLFRHYDHKRQRWVGPRQELYPFPSRQGDAIQAIRDYGAEADLIHASPVCNLYSITNAARRDEYPDQIAEVREACEATGRPYVIENVPRAPLRNPMLLCGRMFKLTATDHDGTVLHLDRHRLFESNVLLYPPGTCQPHDRSLQVAGSYGGARRNKTEARRIRKGGYVPAYDVQQQLLGIDWMPESGLHQAIPPVYTEWIGRQIRDYLEAAA